MYAAWLISKIPYYTNRRIAKIFGVHHATIRSWICKVEAMPEKERIQKLMCGKFRYKAKLIYVGNADDINTQGSVCERMFLRE